MVCTRTSIIALAWMVIAASVADARTTTAEPYCHYKGTSYEKGAKVVGQTLTCTCLSGKWANCVSNSSDQSDTDSGEKEEEVYPPTGMDEHLTGAKVSFISFLDNFDNEDFVFDFTDSNKVTVDSLGLGGNIQPVNLEEFPIMQLAGMSYSRFSIGPCGINLPHVHPRATESLYMIEGQVTLGFVSTEDRLIMNDLEKDQVTFFPKGHLHYQQNMNCENAEFISILDNEDPGVLVVSSALLSLPDEALTATFNEDQALIAQLRLGLPEGPARARSECLARCGLDMDTPL
ncbi:hypothetical protein SARC_08543 [Sphaeroforma arctica JP610]|uniref:Cupin type-1 domain-containing protein n=1 Tax=Sphaeroforma arctica JP610 TaxID=667725 RepID=A0A0L0FR85_9EUKA|nr:hypothetical protein SARC_08543 [Sphaeroforma arctica JP610]KNC79056.1 hypothetical protein SARC_08543 [Sphaeroforma arctica JP610]|eukprot:XP_014152958.1 hypothetical protein SARC_08543 [Sphaeroforma arctica JP610]